MIKNKPWALGPFELLQHAEDHRKNNSDFDRRMALVSFDNSIELSIITFLSLNPIQREGLQFQKKEIAQWLSNYHSKIEFFEHYIVTKLNQEMLVERDAIIFYHQLRNELYHKGNGFVPDKRHISGIREVALWVFSKLFNVNVEKLLDEETPILLAPIKQVSGLSSSTVFLETFISMKKSLDMLLESLESGEASYPSNIVESWKNIISRYSDELPQEYLTDVREAEILRNAILSGESISIDDKNVRQLSDELEKLSGYIDSKLRHHQVEIVDRAIAATLNALPPDGSGKAGIIWQTIGSGLGISILSYVVRAFFHSRLQKKHIVVLVDRTALAKHFYKLLFDYVKHDNLLPLVLPRSKEELKRVFESNSPQIIISTVHKFTNQVFASEFQCLLIGYDLRSFPESLFAKFDNSTVILFSSSPPKFNSKFTKVFGDLVASYDMEQAIRDANILPIKVEKRNLESKGVNAKLAFDQMPKNHQYLMAEDILRHFASRQNTFLGKGIIVVPSRLSSYALCDAILKIKSTNDIEYKSIGDVSVLSVSESPQERLMLLEEFRQDTSGLSLLIVTVNWLKGYDNPLVHTIYLLNRSSGIVQYQLVGRINRPYENKEYGLIVDYKDNNWNQFLDFISSENAT